MLVAASPQQVLYSASDLQTDQIIVAGLSACFVLDYANFVGCHRIVVIQVDLELASGIIVDAIMSSLWRAAVAVVAVMVLV